MKTRDEVGFFKGLLFAFYVLGCFWAIHEWGYYRGENTNDKSTHIAHGNKLIRNCNQIITGSR